MGVPFIYFKKFMYKKELNLVKGKINQILKKNQKRNHKTNQNPSQKIK